MKFLLKLRTAIEPLVYATYGAGTVEAESFLTLTATIVFAGDTAYQTVFGMSINASTLHASLVFEDGRRVTGRYLIDKFECVGTVRGEQVYRLTLEYLS